MPDGDIPYADLVWRGKIGPATLSKPEPGWATTIPQDLEHETSAGRKVPTPERQALESMLRGEGLRMQAGKREMRESVVRGGAVKAVHRAFGPGLVRNRAGGIPSWGTSNLRYASHGTTVKEAAATPSKNFRGRLEDLFAGASKMIGGLAEPPPPTAVPPAPPPPPPPPPVGTPQLQPVPLMQPGQRFAQLRPLAGMRRLTHIEQAEPGRVMQLAERRGIPVSGWAKTLNNPITNLMVQMGAISAVEPVLSGLGLQNPLFYMMAPLAVMSFLPDYLKKWSGIEKIREQLKGRAKAQMLGQSASAAKPRPELPTIDPAVLQAKWDKFKSKLRVPKVRPVK